jgi:predicted SAM-dependent methyltransferase
MIRHSIPSNCRSTLRTLRHIYYRIRYVRKQSTNSYFCPVCQTGLRKFQTVAWGDTRCFICGSDERHRLIWQYFTKCSDLFDGRSKTMLHVAPEIQFEKTISSALGVGYITADLLDPTVKVKMDVTNIQYPDAYFDVIYCSHVLEHVPNDRQAMREFVRVLKPTGWAAIMVPYIPDRGETFEDFSVTNPTERLRVFGQEDHVRIYGNDVVDRLSDAGFKVRVVRRQDFLSSLEIARFNLTVHSGDVFLCTKSQE